jgi:hypothetical protein
MQNHLLYWFKICPNPDLENTMMAQILNAPKKPAKASSPIRCIRFLLYYNEETLLRNQFTCLNSWVQLLLLESIFMLPHTDVREYQG